MRKHASKIVPAILLCLAASAQGSSDCDGELLCITAVKSDGNVELHAENRSGVPVTFTLKVSTRYMTADKLKTITETIAANESRRVMTLRPDGGDRQRKYRFKYEYTVGRTDAAHDDEHIYRFPYANGKSYRVLQGYGSRFSHTGLEQFSVDFRMTEGTPVHAARAGIVAQIEEAHSIGCWKNGCGKYANYVVILHDDQTTGEYYHLQQNGALVEAGDRVDAGQLIALSGNTGHTTMPHLHFGVYRAAKWGRDQSIPVRFVSADGIVERPRRGGLYPATTL